MNFDPKTVQAEIANNLYEDGEPERVRTNEIFHITVFYQSPNTGVPAQQVSYLATDYDQGAKNLIICQLGGTETTYNFDWVYCFEVRPATASEVEKVQKELEQNDEDSGSLGTVTAPLAIVREIYRDGDEPGGIGCYPPVDEQFTIEVNGGSELGTDDEKRAA